MGKHALSDVPGFVRRHDYFSVDPRELVVEYGFNPRSADYGQDEADLELVDSVRENGVIQPVKIQRQDNKLILRDGHRRHWACMQLIDQGVNIKAIPAMLIDKNTSPEQALYVALTSNTGKPLTPFEESTAFKRLRDYGNSADDIAKKTGRSVPFVYNRLKLINATPETRQAVEDGEVTVAQAAKAVDTSEGNPEKQAKAVEKAAKQRREKVTVKWSKKDGYFVIVNADEAVTQKFEAWFTDEFADWLTEMGLDYETVRFTVSVSV